MASFRKRGELQWQARVARKGFPAQVKTFNTKSDAEAWAATVESTMARGTFVSSAESERTTFGEALERYQREITVGKKGIMPEQSRIKKLLGDPLAIRSLASIRSSDIANYRDNRLKKVSPQTVIHEINLISNLFNVARKEWGMENLINPVEVIKKPKLPNGRDRRLVNEEETRLLTAAGESSVALKSLIVVALGTAMRLGELLRLSWIDVDLDKRVALLRDTKNGDARQVPLSTAVIAALEPLPRNEDDPRVFWHWKASDSIQATWRRAIKRAQELYEKNCREMESKADSDFLKNFRFHDLRHEAASRLFELGFNPMEVAAITGHKTLQMLKRYTHLRAEDLAKRMG
ncbi:tyrosine-type recombinase/integrase [Collimonas antrihumi]|uniref:tyrosine-type recombinase/integrase n=1 Tax=Collimonas antrihumi TaxID=1940615 RepID=UPI001B8BDB32|nr:site-specific integrase [Collimonas antrihumi]